MEHWVSHGLVASPAKLSDGGQHIPFQGLVFALMAVWLTWAMRDICSGSNIRLRAHKNIGCPRNPSFHWLEIGTTMQPRDAVVWSGVAVTVSSTPACRFLKPRTSNITAEGSAEPKPPNLMCAQTEWAVRAHVWSCISVDVMTQLVYFYFQKPF